MQKPRTRTSISLEWMEGGGEMGARMRAFDWSRTSLGPAESWPQSLRSPLSMLLPSKAQIILFWGPDFVVFYNDAYRPVFGGKHPQVLGQPGRIAWSEIWESQLHALLDGVVRTGEAFHARDLLFVLERHGFLEDTYFDVSYDPVRDESGAVGGVYCIVTETTGRVVGERRLALLRECAERTAPARREPEACALAIASLTGKPDVAFALAYLGSELAAATPSAEAALQAAPPQAVTQVPFAGGTLVVGLNARRPYDEQYASFLGLLAGQLGTATTNARAYEEERRRAETLAEIDRAKTAFFSNVSHEFRTPLTLMLGPIADMLSRGSDGAGDRDLLEVVHRNGLRLHKLVNTLLDFSRIEAGRVQAAYEPTELGPVTADLASNFRSACERAGVRLTINCESVAEPIYVDREMWEKIVLNLLSNAFKFTFEGEIAVRLRDAGDTVELTVRDTGTGIPEQEMPFIFERFHRVKGARGRAHEGTGIGLALVHELVKLHGGAIRARSVLNRGSVFTVSIPKGHAHLPDERVGRGDTPISTALGVSPYLEEALRWLPDTQTGVTTVPLLADDGGATDMPSSMAVRFAEADARRPRVVWADDNADMRDYVRRLLGAQFDVEAVATGRAALEAVRAQRPDLVLADVMMPELDGFELLRELRASPDTCALPVILLSARAGEEARIEGLQAGADDYLTKPFNARELMTRVGAHIQMARVRREAERAVSASERQLAVRNARLVLLSEALEHLLSSTNPDSLVSDLFPKVAAHLGIDTYFNYMVSADGQLVLHSHAGISEETARDISVQHSTGMKADLVRSLGIQAYVCHPLMSGGRVLGTLSFASRTRIRFDEDELEFMRLFTHYVAVAVARADAERSLRHRAEQFETLLNQAPLGVYVVDADFRMSELNPVAQPVFDLPGGALGRDFEEVVHAVWGPDYADEIVRTFRRTLETGIPYSTSERSEFRIDRGITETYEWRVDRLLLPDGRYGVVCYFRDVSAQMLTRRAIEESREALRDADRRKDEFIATLAHELRNPLSPIRTGLELIRLAGNTPVAVDRVRTMMERQVDHMVRLIDDLLDVSRITSGKIRLQRKPMPIAELVHSAVEANRAFIASSEARLTVSLPETPFVIDVDPTRFVQVLSNLLHNAAKFTPGGQIQLAAETTSDGSPDGMMTLTVTDTGAGISAEMLPRVFELFTQADHSSSGLHGGLGIGLALARRLMELHGGTIEAHSDGLGRGSRFTVRMPLASRVAVAPNLRRASTAGKLDRRVVIIDDNADSAATLAMLVEELGGSVRTASDGVSGIACVEEFRPDVVLLDVGMPGVDGYETCRRIRRRLSTEHVFVVAITGWGQEQDKQRAFDAGFDAHLTKPPDPLVLERLLASPRP